MVNFTILPHKACSFTTQKHKNSFPTQIIVHRPKNSFHSFPTNTQLKLRLLSCNYGRNNEFLSKRVDSLVAKLRLEDDVDQALPLVTDSEDELDNERNEKGDAFELKWPPWKNLPPRYKLIGTTSLAFVICNMDKVNLSVAIIPMSHQFGWNASVAGLVQSSFFWGYALSQLPGGWLAKIFGGRQVLALGVLAWSLATAFIPVLAGYMPGLVLSRILVGIGEGVSPSAATDLIARSIPLEERSRAVAFVFGGLSVGSVAGLLLAPPLIENFGWESVFYLFGLLGVACISMEKRLRQMLLSCLV
ncbi:unnamed protein product [Amaranthus hypochondriacus]